jgi:lipid-binding SYLF domain-containing protein
MKRSALTLLVVFLTLTHLNAAATEDCSKCQCVSYPVEEGCERCCLLSAAKKTLDEIMMTPDKGVPQEIMQQATCVGVIPGLKKAAFVVGGEYGRGVVTCRTGHGWSAPAFITLSGGSFGFQIGGQSTDLVLVAVNDKGFQDLLKNKFKIGGDAAASAGPVGRNSQAATDWELNAGLLTYSRSRGLFAFTDLNGIVVSHSKDDTQAFYGAPYGFEEILKGNVLPPSGAKPFVRTVAKYFMTSQNR